MKLDRRTRSLLGFRSQCLDVAPTVARPKAQGKEPMSVTDVAKWLLALEQAGQIRIRPDGVIEYT